MVGPLKVAGCLEHLFERVHHLHGCTKLGTTCRITEMHLLITCPKTGRKSECVPDDLEGILRSIQILRVMRPLPPYHRLLEAVCKVYRMHRILSAELVGLAPEHRCPWGCLAMDKVAELEKELVTGDIVEPIYDVKVVTSAPLAPECPVVKRLLRKVCKLILEIVCENRDDALITCSHIVLLEDLESNHLRPPVLGLSSLETFDVLA